MPGEDPVLLGEDTGVKLPRKHPPDEDIDPPVMKSTPVETNALFKI